MLSLFCRIQQEHFLGCRKVIHSVRASLRSAAGRGDEPTKARAHKLKAETAKLARRYASLTQWLAMSENAHTTREAAAKRRAAERDLEIEQHSANQKKPHEVVRAKYSN